MVRIVIFSDGTQISWRQVSIDEDGSASAVIPMLRFSPAKGARWSIMLRHASVSVKFPALDEMSYHLAGFSEALFMDLSNLRLTKQLRKRCNISPVNITRDDEFVRIEPG